jgi:hypothetical protein
MAQLAAPAALGFSPHVGWAAVVAVSGPTESPEVNAKRRVDLATTFEEGAVFHSARELGMERATELVERSERTFTAKAERALSALVADLRKAGLELVAGAILSGGKRPLPPLDAILRSHALVHAAEGALYRKVFAQACETCGVAVAWAAAGDLPADVAAAARLPRARVLARLAEMGERSGRPWARDQKDAALAAWLALVSARGDRGR